MTMIAVLFFADVIALNTNVFLLVHKKRCTQRRSFFFLLFFFWCNTFTFTFEYKMVCIWVFFVSL